MEPIDASETSPTSAPISGQVDKKHQVQQSIQANREHQAALKSYTEKLESELEALDKLLNAAEVNDDEEPDLDVGGYVSVPGSTRAVAPISINDLLDEDSPFFEDAERRQRYLDFTGYHSMKSKELEDLAEAVRTENYRLHALQAQRQGQFSFTDLKSKSSEFLEQNKEEIDWERVATAISNKSQSHVQRTPKECEIRWLGDRHPEFNHTVWTQNETNKCKDIVSSYSPGPVDWVKVATDLGTFRTPLDCMRHGTTRRTHVWTPEADEDLLDAIKIYGTNNWLIVARVVSPDATAQQCQNRFQRSLDPELKRGPWAPEEDAKLRLAVEAYGNAWLDVANTIEGRNNEQCRDRWNEKLDPKINRDAWNDDEDARLLEVVAEIGPGKWKAISEKLGNGRKDSACRSRYDVLKKRKGKGKVVEQDEQSGDDSRSKSRRPNRKAVTEVPENAKAAAAPAPPKPRPKPRRTTKAKGKEKQADPEAVEEEEPAQSQPNKKRKAVEPVGQAEPELEEEPAGEDEGSRKRGRLSAELSTPERPLPRKRGKAAEVDTLVTEPTRRQPSRAARQRTIE